MPRTGKVTKCKAGYFRCLRQVERNPVQPCLKITPCARKTILAHDGHALMPLIHGFAICSRPALFVPESSFLAQPQRKRTACPTVVFHGNFGYLLSSL